MVAAVLTGHGGPDMLEIREVPRPRPGPGQVQVQVAAAAVNNTDIWTREGAYGLPGDPSALAGGRGPVSFPRIQGGDVAGYVSAVGPGGDGTRIGSRVVLDPAFYDRPGEDANPVGILGSEADGGFAEYVVVAAERAHEVGDSPLTDEQLACLPVAYGTAMGMLERAALKAGERLLVTGSSGGVGFALVQLAAARGVRVLALTSGDKAGLVTEAGAAEVLRRDTGGSGSLAATIANAAPEGLDAVADVVGGPGLAAALAGLREGGRLVICGAVDGAVVPFDLRRLYLHNRTMIGSTMHTPAHFRRLIGQARAGRIRPRVAARFPLREITVAQESFLARHHVGKIVLLPTVG
jgi:NADPH:quinone reductase-like Zn-dependent oxidoreductase